jgi:hypothetical protein
MACLYQLQGGPFYESHEFAMLFFRHFLDTLMIANIVEVSVSLVKSKNGDVVIYTPIIDYSCHPNSLEHLSLMSSPQFTKKLFPSDNLTLNGLPIH